jgi:hypothetical protein
MANRTDTQWQVEFAGTLAQRRKLYQERRLKNGIEAGRVIKRMREETGLTKESNANGDQASAWKVRFQGGSHYSDSAKNIQQVQEQLQCC